MPKKKTQEEIAAFFASKGHELIGNYINSTTPVEYKCGRCNKAGNFVYYRKAYGKKWIACRPCTLKVLKNKMEIINASRTPEEKAAIKERAREKSFAKTGYHHHFENPEVKEKKKQNYKEKTGYENPGQNPEVKKKMEDTNFLKRGVRHSLQDPEVREKGRKNYEEKTGYGHPSQNPEVKKKAMNTYEKKTGYKHTMQNPEHKKMVFDNYKEKTGYAYPSQNPKVRIKIEASNLKNFGVKNVQENPEVRAKTRKTNLERHGDEYPSRTEKVKEKIKETNMKRRGVPHTLQDPEIREKAKNTNIKKYGVPYNMQDPDVFRKAQKSAFSRKDFTFPSGRIFSFQGYEDMGIEFLLKEGHNEDDILSPSEIGLKIPYEFEGKPRIYHPDIFVRSQNLIVEVKSKYTASSKAKHSNLIEPKLKACRNLGYSTLLLVFKDRTGEIIQKDLSLNK